MGRLIFPPAPLYFCRWTKKLFPPINLFRWPRNDFLLKTLISKIFLNIFKTLIVACSSCSWSLTNNRGKSGTGTTSTRRPRKRPRRRRRRRRRRKRRATRRRTGRSSSCSSWRSGSPSHTGQTHRFELLFSCLMKIKMTKIH